MFFRQIPGSAGCDDAVCCMVSFIFVLCIARVYNGVCFVFKMLCMVFDVCEHTTALCKLNYKFVQ